MLHKVTDVLKDEKVAIAFKLVVVLACLFWAVVGVIAAIQSGISGKEHSPLITAVFAWTAVMMGGIITFICIGFWRRWKEGR